LLVPAHVLALVALGLFLGRQDRHIAALIAFALALAIGLLAIALAIGETQAPTVLLAATAVLGALVAAAWTPPRPAAPMLAAVVGVAIALDSPPDAVTVAEGNLMLVGTGLGACALLAAIVAITRVLTRAWQRIGLRIAGSWIAASALLVLALALR
jgi:urease accessory protein